MVQRAVYPALKMTLLSIATPSATLARFPPDTVQGCCQPAALRACNTMKHVCVAARIGDCKALDAGNSRPIAQSSNAASADSGCNPAGIVSNLHICTWGWREFWPMPLSKGSGLELLSGEPFFAASAKIVPAHHAFHCVTGSKINRRMSARLRRKFLECRQQNLIAGIVLEGPPPNLLRLLALVVRP